MGGPKQAGPPETTVALVTGASKGIGRAVAVALGGPGAKVAVGYSTDADGACETCEGVIDAGASALSVHLDVTDPETIEAAFTLIEASFGPVSILVNNAGVSDDHLLLFMDESQWLPVIDTNLNGTFRVTRRAVRPMVSGRYGRIVNVGSVIGSIGAPGAANYAASKAALVGFTRAIARELAPRGITCNVVTPGPITTAMTHKMPEEWRQQLLDLVPAQRFGSPEDVASIIAYLCRPEAGYVTGAVIPVDGGLSMGL